VLALADDERALLTVLLLRGPQAPGELRTRTDRLHAFADRGAVEQCLAVMAAREEPLVKDLGRRPGQQDHRWVHLLGDLPVETGPTVVVDREQALSDGLAARDARLAAAFAELSDDHADERARQLFDSPFEWWVLTRAVELAGDRPVADVGCGAGAVSAYLADLGADVTGFDSSPQQIMCARRRHPEVMFEEADLRRLLRPATAAAWGGLVVWDVLNHFAPSELPAIVRGLVGTLAPDGVLVLALDVGASDDATRVLGEQAVPWVLHDQAAVRAVLAGAGLADVEAYLRLGPADRLYVLARRPTAP
jgi:trans-aconitate methyltransferase